MSTAMIPARPKYLAKATPAATAAFSGGITEGMALPMLSIRGKEFRFRFQGQEMSTRSRDLEVIFVAAREGISKRWYQDGYTAGSVIAPSCSAADGRVPDVAEPVSATCATCPKNAWGSKITQSGAKGKECSDYKRLVVLPLFDGKPADQPTVLDVPATSLRSPKAYRGQELFLREYLSTLERHDIPPTAVVTKLTFTDAEYPQLTFAFSRYLDESEFASTVELAESDDVVSVLGAEAVEAEAPIVQLPPKPAAVKTAARAATKPKPAPTPVEEQSELPLDEPGQAGPSAPEGDTSDILAQVKALLRGKK